jgi:hypothetical protein
MSSRAFASAARPSGQSSRHIPEQLSCCRVQAHSCLVMSLLEIRQPSICSSLSSRLWMTQDASRRRIGTSARKSSVLPPVGVASCEKTLHSQEDDLTYSRGRQEMQARDYSPTPLMDTRPSSYGMAILGASLMLSEVKALCDATISRQPPSPC